MGLTTTATLTQDIQDAISAELLVAPDDVYLFYGNGPVQKADADAKEAGTNVIHFNRPTLPTAALMTEASRRLTDGTAISVSDSIAIAMSQVDLTTREYAGPHDGSNVVPYGVTEFLKNRAKHNVVLIVGEFLRRDRNRWLDTVVMNLLLASTVIVTADGTAEGSITAGQVMSVAMLRSLNKKFKDTLIPTFPNGRWRAIINSRDEQNLKADEEYREAYRYFQTQNPAFSGHAMTFEGFDLMVSTRFATKGVGAASAVTGYQGVAFGPYGIGHGEAMAPTVRKADDTDYGRQEKVIWKSEEAIGTLYADLIVRTIST